MTSPSFCVPLEELGEVAVFDGIPGSVEEVVKRAGDADIIAFGLMQFTNEMLDKLPNLEGTSVHRHRRVELRRCGLRQEQRHQSSEH